MSTTEIVTKDVKKLQVKEATEVGAFYGVPQTMVNLFFLDFAGTLYPKEAFLLYQAQKKGYQRLHVTVVEKSPGYWEAEASIYPVITSRMLENIVKLDPSERKEMIHYLTQPTVEWGRASKDTVKAAPMQPYLKEMAIKRAVARVCRLFSGVGTTAFEELPEATMTAAEAKEAADMAKPVEDAKVSDVRPTPPVDLAVKPLEDRLAYDLQPWIAEVQVVSGIDVVEVKMPTGMAEGPAKAIRQIMDAYAAKRSMQGNELSYTVAR